MRLIVLGSGGAVPTRTRYPSSYLLEHGATRVLVDCGYLAIARLLERNIDFQSIAAVAITHFHPDHLSHLLPLVHARFVDDLHEKRAHRPLAVFGPASLGERWRKLREVFWVEPHEEYPLELHEGAGSHSVGDIHLEPFPIRHVPWFASVGYRFTVGSARLAYTGDLGPKQDDEFFETIRGVDVLLIEGSAARPSSETHLTAAEAVAFGRKADAKRVVLTHLRDSIIELAQREASAHPDFVTVAEDGLTIDL